MSAIHSVEQVRTAEKRAIETHGIPEATLMARAGAAAFDVLRTRWPEARRVAVVCGPGNNGGDGRVVAQLLEQAGAEVAVLDLGDPGARHALETPFARGTRTLVDGKIVPGTDAASFDVVVDAMFGIGLSRPLDGDAAAMVEAINAYPAPVLALDVPSGLDADTGVATGPVVVADATVTFIAFKRGLFTADGPRVCGRVSAADLDLPTAVFDGLVPVASVLPHGLVARLLGRRDRDAHKGRSGHVLVVGGAPGMQGAAVLAAEAALRCGAGLASVASTGDRGARAELMVHAVADADALAPLLERATVVAIGPGLGLDDRAHALFDAVLAAGKPTVIDADALAVAKPHFPLHADCVITPHPGEAARLLGVGAADIQVDRFAAAAELVAVSGAVTVLKGAATLVVAPDAAAQVCIAGNPGMAAGGFGDVLTGVIAALIAQGLPPSVAAAAGVQLHAEAGDLAAASGERGMLAADLFPHLRALVNPR